MASLLAAAPVRAQQSPAPAKVRQAALTAAKHYMTAIACAESPFAVATLEPYRHDKASNFDHGRFAVIWAGDIGCRGGSASSTTNIAIVDIQFPNNFLVDAKRSSPNVEFDLPMQNVDRVVRSTEDTLVVEGREFGPNDALCCASDRWRVTLKASELGNWSTIEQQHLAASKR